MVYLFKIKRLDLKKEIVKTRDGSNTLFVPELDETYHSSHGAIQESLHVFILNGLNFQSALNDISILEVGFGTGLNAFLSFIESIQTNRKITYTTLEPYPLEWDVVSKLNYMDLMFNAKYTDFYQKIHSCAWESFLEISSNFYIKKQKLKLQDVVFDNEFDVIYFDAFAPRVQPDLWTEQIFASMYKALRPDGVLVTYCAKGSVKRTLKHVGFELQSIPGPPGKREMSRAIK